MPLATLMSGLAYQLGIPFPSSTSSIRRVLRDHFGYRRALAAFESFTVVLLAISLSLGTEAHRREFVGSPGVIRGEKFWPV